MAVAQSASELDTVQYCPWREIAQESKQAVLRICLPSQHLCP